MPREKQAYDAAGLLKWALCTTDFAYAGVKRAAAADIPVRYSSITMQANAGSAVPADKTQGQSLLTGQNLRPRGRAACESSRANLRLLR